VQELETGPLHRFQDWPNEQVPRGGAGVYTVWDATGGRYRSREAARRSLWNQST
jgi:hypothetical protein